VEYWESLRWGAYIAAAAATWRFLPLAVVQMVAAFTRDETRSRQCMEVLRLSRRDLRRVPSYLPVLPLDHETCGRDRLPDLTQRPPSPAVLPPPYPEPRSPRRPGRARHLAACSRRQEPECRSPSSARFGCWVWIRIAVRGCRLRAASSEPHVRRVS
jgi:hypothetical protein